MMAGSSYPNLRSMNVRHLGMVKAKALKSMASKSPSMAWPTCQVSQKSTKWFKTY
jgi:hypothetical protein